jgi:ATPase subunit of ABC transporter with duplicated ATPase domains
MSIIVSNISYIHPDREVLFQDVSFSVPAKRKVNLIGDNGSGKSTMLKLISGELDLSGGEIAVSEKPYYIPQHFGQYNNLSVAEALGIDQKLRALHAILGGNASAENFNLLNDDWSVEERIKQAFEEWNISYIDFSIPMDRLSGGEKTKVFLAGITIHDPSIVLLDEPSNHLDAQGRERLYEFIRISKATIVLVSHDRTMLNLIDYTYELTKNGVEIYGGNYEFYKQQKEEKLNALYAQLDGKEKELKQARRTAQLVSERKQRLDSRGKKAVKEGGIPRIMLKKIKDGAEATATRLKEAHSGKISQVNEELQQIQNEIAEKEELKITFENSNLHKGKILVEAKEINYGYGSSYLWKSPLTFQIRSGDRIAISGNNGSGKTTLLNIILGNIEPGNGNITRADFNYLYMDQEYSFIDGRLTVLEQVQKCNSRKLLDHELKMLLHRFLFPYDTWNKTCDKLSGGERMKLMFCCLIVNNNIPDMFILDEPTNNLDIQSLNIITSTLKEYKGTILVVSHDRYFKSEIGIDQYIDLDENNL